MKFIVREPLAHFLIAGVTLFFIFGLFGEDTTPDNETIVIGPGQITLLAQGWKKQWRRMPTEQELLRLIDSHIEEEVLFREAIAMGLDQDDTIIRRRLAQKMKFLIQDLADQAPITEKELKKYFEGHADQFIVPERRSFIHVYFNVDKRAENAERDAMAALDILKKDDRIKTSELGDPFMLRSEYVEMAQAETMRDFGETFAQAVFKLEKDKWYGPVVSSYGLHLVRVSEIVPSRMPGFKEVEEDVRVELVNDRRNKTNRKAIENLKSRYTAIIEETTPSPAETARAGGGS